MNDTSGKTSQRKGADGEAQAEAETIKDAIKAHMGDSETAYAGEYNRNRELLSEFYGLLAALAVVCENGTEGDIRLLRVLASLRAHKQEVAR